MASLQARSPLRSSHPILFLNRLISFTIFASLLCFGWVTLSYIKNQLVAQPNPPATTAAPPTAASPLTDSTVRIDQQKALDVQRLSSPVKLVYSCANDQEFYHLSTHLPSQTERSALSEEAALKRNLKPCSVCIPQ